VLWDNNKLQYTYHAFVLSLSNEALDNFLTAMAQNPDNLTQFLDIASKGSNTDKANLLTATAKLGNSDLGRFIDQANRYTRGTASSFLNYLGGGLGCPETAFMDLSVMMKSICIFFYGLQLTLPQF